MQVHWRRDCSKQSQAEQLPRSRLRTQQARSSAARAHVTSKLVACRSTGGGTAASSLRRSSCPAADCGPSRHGAARLPRHGRTLLAWTTDTVNEENRIPALGPVRGGGAAAACQGPIASSAATVTSGHRRNLTKDLSEAWLG